MIHAPQFSEKALFRCRKIEMSAPTTDGGNCAEALMAFPLSASLNDDNFFDPLYEEAKAQQLRRVAAQSASKNPSPGTSASTATHRAPPRTSGDDLPFSAVRDGRSLIHPAGGAIRKNVNPSFFRTPANS